MTRAALVGRTRELIAELERLQKMGLRFSWPRVLPTIEIPPVGDPLVRELWDATQRVAEVHDRLVGLGYTITVKVHLDPVEED